MKKAIVSAAVVAVCAIGAGAWWLSSSRQTMHATKADGQQRTVAEVWKLPEPETTMPVEQGVIDAPTLQHALRNMRIDADDQLVIDHGTLNALRAGFASLDHIDDAQLASWQRIIRDALPRPADEQVAKLVADYCRYQLAARAMSADAIGGDLENVEAQLNRLIALRHAHFGPDVAEALFGDEQAYTRFTIESVKLEMDGTLTDEMKDRRLDELVAALPTRLQVQRATADPPSENSPQWQARLARFQRGKAVLLRAQLPEDEMNAQIDRLLHEHFSEEEIDRAMHDDPEIGHVHQ